GFKRILDRCAYKSLRSFAGYWLNAATRWFWGASFINAHFFLQELPRFFHFWTALLPFYPCIDVLRISTENNHVHKLRTLNGRRNTVEVTNRTQADIQIKLLSKRNVQGTDTAAYRSRQRTFDRYDVLANRI